jgi:hypothetical protein
VAFEGEVLQRMAGEGVEGGPSSALSAPRDSPSPQIQKDWHPFCGCNIKYPAQSLGIAGLLVLPSMRYNSELYPLVVPGQREIHCKQHSSHV